MSDTTTRGIRIQVHVDYIEDRSDPDQNYYFYAYTIRITNNGTERVQLLHRHWDIVDANGKQEVVHGPGVVGQQPRLGPGEKFEYTSFCPLSTSFGSMSGYYEMVTDSGERFFAQIGSFALVRAFEVN